MRVRVASQLPLLDVGSLKSKELVAKSDNVGFTSYELYISKNETVKLRSHLGDNYNHVYYIIDGTGQLTLPNMGRVNAMPHLTFALTGCMEATLCVADKMRLFVTYILSDPSKPQPLKPNICKLEDIVGTERDIDWFRGRSRRFLRKDDGFNVSLHNTICYKNNTSPLVYRNNYELAYYIRGDVTYTWGPDHSKSHHFKQLNIADGDGCVFLMDENDEHELHALGLDCEVICIFNPPLKGAETHDFSKGSYSAF